MPSRSSPRRPPVGFVPVTPARWRELCDLLEENHYLRDLKRAGVPIGWRAARMWYVDPHGYRDVTGTWPPGYFPG